MLKLGAVSFGVFDHQANKALPPTLKPRPDLEVCEGELLISRANISRLVGATALVEHTRPRLLLPDKIFRVVPFSGGGIDLSFLAHVLRTPGVREQIERELTGTSPTMKNISKSALMALTFPLPPTLEAQRALTAPLTEARAEAERLTAAAALRRADARAAFERALAPPSALPSGSSVTLC